MSSRQLLVPTKPESDRQQISIFRLQPPPNRYKENRRFQVLSKRASDSTSDEGKKDSTLPFRRQKRCSISSPLPADQSEEGREEAKHNLDVDKSQGSRWSQDDSFTYSHSGGLITSPVKSDVCNSAFFGDACVWSPQAKEENAASPDKMVSASRTSFHSIARSTFGATARRRVSLKSPLTAQGKMVSDARHTILQLSPMTPITPRTMSSLHTPCDLQFDMINSQLELPLCKNDSEPLSATLKRIGASRKSMQVKEVEEDILEPVYTQAALSGWESSLMERLEEQKKGEEARKANQEALQQARGLFLFSREVEEDKDADFVRKQPPLWLDKVPFEKSAGGDNGHTGNSNTIRSTLETFANMFKRIRKEEHEHIRLAISGIPDATLHLKGDGWGGVRTRSSWFAEYPLGPLASPTSTSSKPLLRSLQLQPILSKSNTKEEDVWIDIDEDELLVNDWKEQHEMDTSRDNISIQKLRVRFPSFLPKPKRSNKRPVSSQSDMNLTQEAIMVKYTDTSAEGRPLSRKNKTSQFVSFLRNHGGLLLAFFLIIGVAAFVAIIGSKAAQRR